MNGKFKNNLMEMNSTPKLSKQPHQQVFLTVVIKRDIGHITCTVKGLLAFERKSHLLVSSQ